MLGTPLLSFVMSQFFGLYMLIIAIIMFSRAPYYRQLVQKMDPQSGTVVLAGMIGLAVGMLCVGLHNVWTLKPSTMVTIISWFILIFSILWLAIPERMVVMMRGLFLSSKFYVLILVMALSGLYFLARGVYIYATQHDTFLFFSMNNLSSFFG